MVCAAEIIWDNSGHLLNVCLIQLYVSIAVFIQSVSCAVCCVTVIICADNDMLFIHFACDLQ